MSTTASSDPGSSGDVMRSKRIRRPSPTSRTANATRIAIPGWLNWEQKQLNDALAMAAAREAGRAAQVAALEAALRSCDPDHQLLQATDSLNIDGTSELRWHAIYDEPHDAIAVLHGIELLRSPAYRAGNVAVGVAAEQLGGGQCASRHSIWSAFGRRRALSPNN